MLRFLADENFNNLILDGLRDRNPSVDVVRIQDVGLDGVDDPSVLEWAAGNGRIILSHDVNTMIGYAYERVGLGRPMPGLCEVPDWMSIGQVIEDLLMIVACSDEKDWESQVHFLPL
jgi:hypothetical protein